MSMAGMGSELAALGVSGRDPRCLLLLPQIHVGWAIEPRDVAALDALLDSTVRRAGFGPDIAALARRWLFDRPSRGQFQSAFALLRALRRAPDNPTIASSDVLEAMLWACRAAQLERRAAPVNTAGDAVSPSVARALYELEAWLEVDAGELWSDLLADAEPPRPSDVPAAPSSPRLSGVGLAPPRPPLETGPDDEDSLVRLREESATPASAPFPLLRRLA